MKLCIVLMCLTVPVLDLITILEVAPVSPYNLTPGNNAPEVTPVAAKNISPFANSSNL